MASIVWGQSRSRLVFVELPAGYMIKYSSLCVIAVTEDGCQDTTRSGEGGGVVLKNQ